MTTYPLEFHRRSEQKWAVRTQAASARESTPQAARVGHSQRRQREPGRSEARDILGRTPWLREIGRWLRAGYDGVDHSVPPHLAALLKELKRRRSCAAEKFRQVAATLPDSGRGRAGCLAICRSSSRSALELSPNRLVYCARVADLVVISSKAWALRRAAAAVPGRDHASSTAWKNARTQECARHGAETR